MVPSENIIIVALSYLETDINNVDDLNHQVMLRWVMYHLSLLYQW